LERRPTRPRDRRGSQGALSLSTQGRATGRERRRAWRGTTENMHLRAASHAAASCSSSSRGASCPPSLPLPLGMQRRQDAMRPALGRRERAATLRVSLQRYGDSNRRRCRRLFSWLSAPAFLSHPKNEKPSVPPPQPKKTPATLQQLFAAHPQGQRGDTLLQPVDYSVSFARSKERGQFKERERKKENQRHHQTSRSPFGASHLFHLARARLCSVFFLSF
jgi:hypothetical protein